ncbi:hypothetical protein AGDE_16311 [Angomonas deanei]|uniref:Uncharacterized protein n=1 Tax=Angomonas deanei TaxID=59799 RepID=A0A7G2CBZ4_9TRYP|nr:hypothetical protein AGDE_16311 [Angomonas deanei]CAD2216467.1 hypothetical protein, conserved [Angomonas deanei]|eukprot:EPY17333.1 hypothetical protein AGDE_16311 [Angomonas deanei]
MFLFQNISQYTDYFRESPPLALAAINSDARECGERHEEGVLGCNIISDACGRRRTFKVNSRDIACLEHSQWWMERQRDCPLQIIVEFSGTKSLKDIPKCETVSRRLSDGKVEHTFDLYIEGVESLLPFAFLLKRSEVVVLNVCVLNTLRGAFTRGPLLTCPKLTSVTGSFLSRCGFTGGIGKTSKSE